MKDHALWLGLIALPAIVVAVFAPPGFEVFREESGQPVPTGTLERGRVVYAAKCAPCHGRIGGGTGRGPALIGPRRHDVVIDSAAFRRTVRRGVPAAGPRSPRMPAFPGLDDEALEGIIALLHRLEPARAGTSARPAEEASARAAR